MKEIDTVVNSLSSQIKRGADLRSPAPFSSHAEALGTFSAMRSLVQKLESKIAQQCDARQWPNGVTKTAQHVLSLLGELRINEDTVDLLMCGPASIVGWMGRWPRPHRRLQASLRAVKRQRCSAHARYNHR